MLSLDGSAEPRGAHVVNVTINRDSRNHPFRLATCTECGLETVHDGLFDRVPCIEGYEPEPIDVAEAYLEGETIPAADCEDREEQTVFALLYEYAFDNGRPHQWRLQTLYTDTNPEIVIPAPETCTSDRWAITKANLRAPGRWSNSDVYTIETATVLEVITGDRAPTCVTPFDPPSITTTYKKPITNRVA